ncbi:hypothetical protein NM688_g5114 [Phlebia brevispora]|uniref:Uncharacterized protein n=1 Tax=Phlebia brevispora TaxID=194682 RepID=A0ACC1T0N7_9APHY|nr:hypothetical protein NM688_g5114 [Phlebia brevispora]
MLDFRRYSQNGQNVSTCLSRNFATNIYISPALLEVGRNSTQTAFSQWWKSMLAGRQDSASTPSPTRSRSARTRDTIEHAIESRRRDIMSHFDAILRLQEDILSLKYQLNNTTSIGHLPAEVLSEVFAAYLVDPPEPTYYPYREDPPHYWWFKLLHVCREWRQVALSFPRLWTTIYPTRPEVVEVLLTRSRNLPLDVRFTDAIPTQYTLKSYTLVLPQMYRIRRASMEITPAIYEILRSDQSTLNAPLLEDLTIHWSNQVPEVSAFQSSSMPRLHSLTIVNGNLLVLDSLVRPSLTSLTLNTCRIHPMEIINIFSALPCLKYLRLENVSQVPHIHGDPLPPPLRKVALPHLEILEMIEDGPGVAHAYLLSHLLIPSRTKLRFVAGASHNYFAMILPCLLAHLQESPGSRIRPRAIRIGALLFFRVALWMEPRPLSGLGRVGEDDSNLDFTLRGAAGSMDLVDDIGTKFFSSLDLSSLTTMHLEYVRFRSSTWATAFSKMRKLEELGTEGDALDAGFMNVFARSRRSSGARKECIFPSLKVLKLQCIKMKKQPNRWDLQDCLSTLTLALKWRQEAGSYLQRLVFVHPFNMRGKDYETLIHQDVAGEVVKAEKCEDTWSECGTDSEESDSEDERAGDDNADPDIEP